MTTPYIYTHIAYTVHAQTYGVEQMGSETQRPGHWINRDRKDVGLLLASKVSQQS